MKAGSTTLPKAAFYAVAHASYFPGVAAMVNSLRLLGHEETVHLLDCGLEDSQRALLASEAVVVPAPHAQVPHLQKFVLPLERPADAMVLVDADVIFTRSLRELLDAAGEGRVVGFADRIPHRYFPEWGELLGLGAVAVRTYLNIGVLVLPGELGTKIMEHAESRLARVDVDLSMLGRGPGSYPFSYLEQDVVNPVLSALTEPNDVLVLEPRLAPSPPFKGLRVVDEGRLRCRYGDGVEPFALHHVGMKPWLAATATNAYTRLLTRLLLDPGAAVRVDRRLLPLRLRDGAVARPARRWSDARAAARDAWHRARLTVHRARSRSGGQNSAAAPNQT